MLYGLEELEVLDSFRKKKHNSVQGETVKVSRNYGFHFVGSSTFLKVFSLF